MYIFDFAGPLTNDIIKVARPPNAQKFWGLILLLLRELEASQFRDMQGCDRGMQDFLG